MRSSILLSALIIGSSIKELSEKAVVIICITLIIFVIADVIEFFEKKTN